MSPNLNNSNDLKTLQPHPLNASPKQNNQQQHMANLVNKQQFLQKTNQKILAKSPQPLKLSGNMTNETEPARGSPSQISHIMHQREVRNNSQMVISSSNIHHITGGASNNGGAQSVLSQSNPMSITKRHGANHKDASHKWLPSVAGGPSNEKKGRAGHSPHAGGANANSIQIGKGEIHLANQAHHNSQGPAGAPHAQSIKMHPAQQQHAGMRAANNAGQAGNPSAYHSIQEARASVTLGQSRQQRMVQLQNSGKNSQKRGAGGAGNVPLELQYKLQLPEIMQQQQSKINQMKKAHEVRF